MWHAIEFRDRGEVVHPCLLRANKISACVAPIDFVGSAIQGGCSGGVSSSAAGHPITGLLCLKSDFAN
jgi:hypothetical protein